MNVRQRRIASIILIVLLLLFFIASGILFFSGLILGKVTEVRGAGPPPVGGLNLLEPIKGMVMYFVAGVIVAVIAFPIILVFSQAISPLGYIFIPATFYFTIFVYPKTIGIPNSITLTIGLVAGIIVLIPCLRFFIIKEGKGGKKDK
jgi:hypothetical protein